MVGLLTAFAGGAGVLAVGVAEQPTSTLVARVSNPARYARNVIILVLVSGWFTYRSAC
jgi:hypothetical protein